MEAVFDNLWRASNNEDLEATQEFWDLRSEEFNEAVDKDNLNLTQYFYDKGFLKNYYNVLDVGCGVGKNLLRISKYVNNVTGIDISPKMIEYAKKNAIYRNLNNVDFEIMSWQNIDLEKYSWNKNFDLVFASMSPAINSKEALLKINESSRKYCFISSFVYRKDSIRENLIKLISENESIKSEPKSIYYAFNTLWNMGIYPEITYRNVQWENKISTDVAIKMYTMQLRRTFDIDIIEEKVSNYINEISVNGEVEERIDAKIAWMSWKV